MTVYFNAAACSSSFILPWILQISAKTKNPLNTLNNKRYILPPCQLANMFDKTGLVEEGNVVHFGQSLHLLVANAQHQ